MRPLKYLGIRPPSGAAMVLLSGLTIRNSPKVRPRCSVGNHSVRCSCALRDSLNDATVISRSQTGL
jgi:hypothetical protein